MNKNTLKDIVVEEYCQNHDEHEKSKNRRVYIPNWAQTLIDLYTSPLKYVVLHEIQESK